MFPSHDRGGPAPTTDDPNIPSGLNRLYPASTETEVGLRINDERIDWELSDWQDLLAPQHFIDPLTTAPVQLWSAPDGFEVSPGSEDPSAEDPNS